MLSQRPTEGTTANGVSTPVRTRSCCPKPVENPTIVLTAEAREFATLVCNSDYPVLLQGETGVGKTHLARLIHDASKRCHRPLVQVNCGGMPDTLFESEMFGHVRGAFTDAKEAREGFFECANFGTLFLDEIGDLPLHVQPRLLTALEENYIRRLGSSRETRVDVRLIAATNASLAERVLEGRFRQDLYHRCAVLTCRMPALRERARDLPAIVQYFFEQVCETHQRVSELDESARDVLCAYAWPGNLRELVNVLRQAVVLAHGGRVRPSHLPEHVRLVSLSAAL